MLHIINTIFLHTCTSFQLRLTFASAKIKKSGCDLNRQEEMLGVPIPLHKALGTILDRGDGKSNPDQRGKISAGLELLMVASPPLLRPLIQLILLGKH